MEDAHTTKPHLLMFLGLILGLTGVPLALLLLDVQFASPIQGGAGAHCAGWIMGEVLVRIDLLTLGLAVLVAVLTARHGRATDSRLVRLLGVTITLAGLVDAVHLVPGTVMPEGSVTFFDNALGATLVGRLGSSLVLLGGLCAISWGARDSRLKGLVATAVPAGTAALCTWIFMLAGPQPGLLPTFDLHLYTLLALGGAAALLWRELKRARLCYFGRGVLAGLIPLAAGQVLLLLEVHTVVDDGFQVASLLRWFAALVPVAGLGIDYVNSFATRGLSSEMRYLRTVIDTVPHFIYARNTRGEYTLVNQAVAEFFGMKVEEIEGRHVMDIHPDVTQCREWIHEDRETLAHGETHMLPGTVVTHHSGQEIWIDTIKTPLRSALGIADQTLGVSIDVTAKRAVDGALAEALEAAKESSKAKSEFLANMSHEIRTPMNCIIGLTDLMQDMEDDPRHRQYLEMIRMSGASLLTLINDILDISKIEAGQLELDLVDTDLQALVEETAGLIAFNAQSKGLEMVCRLAPGVPTRLMLDPGRLRQVLTNLLNNATKFTQKGHVYLDIEPVGENDGQVDLRFRVTDTGIGIAQDNLDRIFEKFTQAEAGTTRRFGGTGLGLSISQHLVRLMGGRITASSQVGVGTTFAFTIPLAATEAGLAADDAAPDNAQHVLVVTDHDLGGQVLAEQVRSLGHHCRVAVAAEGIDAGTFVDQDEPWTVVLADEAYCGGDSELCRALDAAPGGQRPRKIMLNNLSRLHSVEELVDLGCRGSLAKPVRLSRLAGALTGEPATGTPRPQAATPFDPAAADVDPTDGPRVLLAEDNPFNQKVAVAMLRLLGCRVEVAGTGVQAVDLARREEFDLVLMDCQMPVMDGYEATRRIRDLPAPACDVPIVAMTANALSGDRRACFAAGMTGFLSKPITRDVLRSKLVEMELLPESEPVGS